MHALSLSVCEGYTVYMDLVYHRPTYAVYCICNRDPHTQCCNFSQNSVCKSSSNCSDVLIMHQLTKKPQRVDLALGAWEGKGGEGGGGGERGGWEEGGEEKMHLW